MKLGIYCRISRTKDGNDLSIADQKQKGIKKAKELSLPFVYGLNSFSRNTKLEIMQVWLQMENTIYAINERSIV